MYTARGCPTIQATQAASKPNVAKTTTRPKRATQRSPNDSRAFCGSLPTPASPSSGLLRPRLCSGLDAPRYPSRESCGLEIAGDTRLVPKMKNPQKISSRSQFFSCPCVLLFTTGPYQRKILPKKQCQGGSSRKICITLSREA